MPSKSSSVVNNVKPTAKDNYCNNKHKFERDSNRFIIDKQGNVKLNSECTYALKVFNVK
jgi:hypothetical protein